jgi:hypothetical protein
VQLLDAASGDETWVSDNSPDMRQAVASLRDLDPRSLGGYRVLQNRLTTRDGRALLVRVGASLDFVSHDMSRIDRLALVVVLVMLIAAPVGGYWLAGRATKPLAEIIHMMARLRPAQLHERLPIRHTGD